MSGAIRPPTLAEQEASLKRYRDAREAERSAPPTHGDLADLTDAVHRVADILATWLPELSDIASCLRPDPGDSDPGDSDPGGDAPGDGDSGDGPWHDRGTP
jgi:hypothetical protein